MNDGLGEPGAQDFTAAPQRHLEVGDIAARVDGVARVTHRRAVAGPAGRQDITEPPAAVGQLGRAASEPPGQGLVGVDQAPLPIGLDAADRQVIHLRGEAIAFCAVARRRSALAAAASNWARLAAACWPARYSR